jgi:hypothetical protein
MSLRKENSHLLLLPFPDFFVLSFSDLYFCLNFVILFTTSFNVKSELILHNILSNIQIQSNILNVYSNFYFVLK